MIIQDDFFDGITLSAIFDDESFFPLSMGEGEKVASAPNMYNDPNGSVFSPYMFWDGWWRSPANTLRKEVVQAIWENNLPCPQDDILGFEYWTRTYMAGQYLDTHVDEDTFLYEDTKTFSGQMLIVNTVPN